MGNGDDSGVGVNFGVDLSSRNCNQASLYSFQYSSSTMIHTQGAASNSIPKTL